MFESLLFLHQTFLVSSLGSYSSSSGSTNCTLCPANHYCTTATKTTCDPGSYSLIGSTSCEPCLGGYRCPGSGLDPELCDAGTYARNGSDSCSTCDVGYQCPVDGLDEPSLCLPGLKLLNLPCHVLFISSNQSHQKCDSVKKLIAQFNMSKQEYTLTLNFPLLYVTMKYICDSICLLSVMKPQTTNATQFTADTGPYPCASNSKATVCQMLDLCIL